MNFSHFLRMVLLFFLLGLVGDASLLSLGCPLSCKERVICGRIHEGACCLLCICRLSLRRIALPVSRLCRLSLGSVGLSVRCLLYRCLGNRSLCASHRICGLGRRIRCSGRHFLLQREIIGIDQADFL